MGRQRKIQKVVTKLPLTEKSGDLRYWRTQPYEARIHALEEIRSEYNEWRYGAQTRLQRVYSIVKRT